MTDSPRILATVPAPPILASVGASRRRFLRGTASGLAGAVAAMLGAPGCAEWNARPLHDPRFIGTVSPRGIGPLRPATEADIEMFTKNLTTGVTVHDSFSADSDINARLTWSRRSDSVRRIEHEHRVRTIRHLGPTRDGLFRSHVTYLEDVVQTEKDDRVVSQPSVIVGKSYLVDEGPSGVGVLTPEGYTPSPAEVARMQRLHPKHRFRRREDVSLRRPARDLPPSVASPIASATATLRHWMKDAELMVHALDVQLRGVRDHHGAPCAVFAVRMQGHAETIEGGEKVLSAIDLAGEYSLRLSDGWDAELILQGLKRSAGTVRGNGAPYVFDAIGHLRVVGISRYDLSAVGASRTLDSLERDAPDPGVLQPEGTDGAR